MTERHDNHGDPVGNGMERFAEGVARIARDAYHAPPEVPRDEMWTLIQAARTARGPARRPGADEGTDVIPIRRIRPQPWWAAVAAALVIGVVLGRGSLTGPDPVVTVADSGPEGPAAVEDAASGGDGTIMVPRSYRVAAARHLTRTENFLTMFRVDARTDQLDVEVGAWARRLLTDTRLLLDSPAGGDPELRVLLNDLELVLAQIVQLRVGDEDDVEIIDEGLESSQLLFRLKAARASAPASVGL